MPFIHLVLTVALAGDAPFLASRAPESPLELAGPARRGAYVESAGRKAAIFGTEDGDLEAWVFPFKIAHDLRLSFVVPGDARPIRGADLARRVVVRPEWTTILYSHPAFTVRQTLFATLDDAGVLIDLEAETSEPLTIVASFQVDLKPMWPASLGGQFSRYDPENRRFFMSESLRQVVAFLGSPQATRGSDAPAHNLPDAPSELSITLAPGRHAPAIATIAIAGSTKGLDEAAATYAKLLDSRAALYAQASDHAATLRNGLLSIDTPEDEIDLAFEWAKVGLDRGLVCNPDLGCGLVAGYGRSGNGERPGFGWFFGGDACFNALALDAIGAFDTATTALRFLRDRQRSDGKILHECSQSAARIPWFEKYPYPYYHIDPPALWIVAVHDGWRSAGDSRGLAELWPSVRKAYEFVRKADADGDGVMEIPPGEYGAMELGELLPRSYEDVYVAGISAEAHRAVVELAAAVKDEETRAVAEAQVALARKTLNERFWDPDAKRLAFAIGRQKELVSETTPWAAVPIAFGWIDEDKAHATLDAIGAAELRTDWGTRVVAETSRLYHPLHYNQGTVWPFLGMFPALAEYRMGRPHAALDLLRADARLTFLFSRGYLTEVFSGDRCAPTGEAVPHQLFSTSAFVTPLVRGLLGIDVDAPRKRAVFAPQIPASWPGITVRRVPTGEGTIDLEYRREPTRLRLLVTPKAAADWRLVFAPALDPGAEPVGIALPVEVSLDSPKEVVVELHAGIRLDAEPVYPEVGERSRGIRVLRTSRDSSGLRVLVDGPAGASRKLRVQGPTDVSARELTLLLEGEPGSYVRKEVVIPSPIASQR